MHLWCIEIVIAALSTRIRLYIQLCRKRDFLVLSSKTLGLFVLAVADAVFHSQITVVHRFVNLPLKERLLMPHCYPPIRFPYLDLAALLDSFVPVLEPVRFSLWK